MSCNWIRGLQEDHIVFIPGRGQYLANTWEYITSCFREVTVDLLIKSVNIAQGLTEATLTQGPFHERFSLLI